MRTVVVHRMHRAGTILTLIRVSAQPPHALRRCKHLDRELRIGLAEQATTFTVDADASSGHGRLRGFESAEALASVA